MAEEDVWKFTQKRSLAVFKQECKSTEKYERVPELNCDFRSNYQKLPPNKKKVKNAIEGSHISVQMLCKSLWNYML